jgi:hypothetical protein
MRRGERSSARDAAADAARRSGHDRYSASEAHTPILKTGRQKYWKKGGHQPRSAVTPEATCNATPPTDLRQPLSIAAICCTT